MIGITTLGLSGPGSNVNIGMLHFSQSFKTGASPLDTIYNHIWDTGWGRSYPSAEMQSVYFIFPDDWADTYIYIYVCVCVCVCVCVRVCVCMYVIFP